MTADPYIDLDAERNVLGACLVTRKVVGPLTRALVPADFGSPNAAATFSAVVALHGAGKPPDVATVLDELRRQGATWPEAGQDLLGWSMNVPNPGNALAYAEVVARHAAKRALRGIAAELAEAAADPTQDPGAVADDARARLTELDALPVASPGDVDVDEFVAQGDAYRAPDVVPGLLAEDDRVVVVAAEGAGKSELARQMVVCAAFGLRPFDCRPAPAVPTLLVDLENPRELIRRRLAGLTFTARRTANGDREHMTLWHRPGGIDLRKRADRVALEDVLRRRRPRLVALGPVYKGYTRTARESDEQVASEVQTILDDLRTRYGFALLLEHHAPQANAGVRELRPFGSSLWLRWPEYGLKLSPHKERPGALVVGRWRGDRSEASWPDELHRGDVWPWVGWWRHGVPDEVAI